MPLGPCRPNAFSVSRTQPGATTFARKPRGSSGAACATLNYRLTTGGLYRWEYAQDGRVLDVGLAGPLISNDSDLLLAAARSGAGIATSFEGAVLEDFASGRLVPLLEPWWPTFPGFYLYYPSRAQMPRKLRVFIDFL